MAARAAALHKPAAFTVSPKYPLTQSLHEANPLRYRLGTGRVLAKVDIGPVADLDGLADDVLQLLLPSLKRHEDCDIIDVNPGVGLWSSKLHDAVKPRTHLLLEPEENVYLPFLKPLLDAAGSKYRFSPYDGYDFSVYNRIWDEGLLPRREPLNAVDPLANSPNDSLLFVANMSRYNANRGKSYQNHAFFMVHQLTKAARQHTLFHRYGLVRMLIWMLNDDKGHILPRTVSERNRYTVSIESSADLQEIAGAGFPSARGQRDPALDLLSSAKVADRTAKLGISLPADRGGATDREAQGPASSEGEDLGNGNEDETKEWRVELKSLEDDFRNGVFKEVEATIRPKTGRPKKVKTPQFERLQFLRRKLQSVQRRQEKVSALSAQYDQLIDLERALHEETTSERNVTRTEFETSQQEFSQAASQFGRFEWQDLAYHIDNRQAMKSNPPLLQWDRRHFEPLNVEEDEFFPRFPLALLHFQPKSDRFAGKSTVDVDYAELFQGLVSLLFRNPTNSVKKALETLGPGAADALIPLAPSLTNPLVGGRTNLDDLRVRMLTQQMLQELVFAWAEWPFRPSTTDLMLRTATADDPILDAK